MKTFALIGTALDWAVAKCEGHDAHCYIGVVYTTMHKRLGPECHYSTDWSQGGPIIERERIVVTPVGGYWEANGCKPPYHDDTFSTGDTPLIAAMRCYVASRLGDEVEVPEELK
jgi:hypothetical protein